MRFGEGPPVSADISIPIRLPMEASAISPSGSTQLSFFAYKPYRSRAYPGRPWMQRIGQPSGRIQCQKMYVPGESSLDVAF